MRSSSLFALTFAAVATMFVAEAGPPLICHPYNIGEAKSLAWGAGPAWDARDASYDVRNLANDTVAILSSGAPVLVRMETMRRAVIYGAEDHAMARELLARLEASAQSQSRTNALAYFDYGFFVASLKQIQWLYKEDLSGGVDGYAFVQKALAINPDSAEMHFAAAIMTSDPPRPAERDAHLAKVRAAKGDPLLAANLASHIR
jgi:hypothetical protein